MAALQILAGPTAYTQLEQHGFQQSLFTQLFAASGGPKWLSIAGLDQYLFSEFFADRDQPLYTMGASSGAWRIACFAQQNPKAAYERLIEHYVHQRYETKPSRQQVNEQVSRIITGVLGEQQGADIVSNEIIRSHFVVCRARGLNKIRAKAGLGLGLALTAATNIMSRRSVKLHFERVIVSHQDTLSPFASLSDLPTRQAQLTEQNLQSTLMATGAIPLLLNPVRDIFGLPKGKYYDGGITDYHFDMPLPPKAGLSLYPHFYPQVSPGWFDKSLPWRKAASNLHNAVILAPTDAFIQQLSKAKIPDRNDFSQLETQERIDFWLASAKSSWQLAEELHEIIASNQLMAHVQRIHD
ncbi:alpha/beta hydrolase [Shewanella maritima]|uniref:alpha/beta hydrolase n=1 Tax=Shewanella maritima TaxID=2520507 RepID=UPI003736DF83